ncbi:Type-1 restriction enzyme EcoKI specificity protein [Methanosarcinales archaeon]|nr:restriction endonuclease subunit S [Candidatus Methanoperedens sp.]CAG0968802.1 Type-1 restriction enzyme EcoKI specificity protein [Methanosarcinales archaeon]
MSAELKQNAATGAPASCWKPYPAYRDSGVEWMGKVPEHWEVKKLKWVSNLIYGSSLSNDQRIEGKVPVYGSNGIIGYHNQAISKKPCIIIGRKGSFGKINYSNIECFPIDTTYYIDETATKNDLLWLLYVLYTLNLDSLSKDSAVPGLSREDAYDKVIFVPPISEQRAISLYLDDRTQKIDSLIEKKQKMIELLKEERAAVINQAVPKGLDPDAQMKDSGIEWLGEVPEHWKISKLKYVVKGKLEYGANESAELEDINLPRYIRITDFGADGKLKDDTFKSLPFEIAKDYILQKGDILFARSGATVGKTFQFKSYQGIACFAGYLIKASPDENRVLSDYLYLFTKSNVYENWKNNVFIQATIQNIGADKYNYLQITTPSIEEQKSIVQFIESESAKIDSAVSIIEKELLLLQEYRTALISEVVTGKIDVREAT